MCIDFSETSASVERLDTIQALILLAAKKGLLLHQLYVKLASISTELEEEIYVRQLHGFMKRNEEKNIY